MTKDSLKLIRDPNVPWPGGFPYQLVSERLVQKGLQPLGPGTPANAVKDALFDLMTHEDRVVLDELRYVDRRLCVDFFMYQFPELQSLFCDSLWNWPMPLVEPDFQQLADIDVDLANALPTPELNLGLPDVPPMPIEGIIDGDASLDLGPLPLQEAKILMEAESKHNDR